MTALAQAWSATDVPDLTGQTVAVTGATSGLGLVLAREIAGHGAHVLMTGRDADRGRQAVEQVRAQVPDASVELVCLDLADLSSVRAAAADVRARHPRLDVLIDNAGVMATPRRRTVDGFELQLATNHLGHFALTGLLLPALLAAPAPRVVVVSSFLHTVGRVDFGDLMGERRYGRWQAYAQSKLANVLFFTELQRRAIEAGSDLLAVGAHPGWSATNLQQGRLGGLANRLFAQPADVGALPVLYAAAMPDVGPFDYLGPSGPLELRGAPHRTSTHRRGRDPVTGARLWERSEQLTGVTYDW